MSAILEDIEEIVVGQWGTLNTIASPEKLPEGHSPDLQNVWMDEKPGSVISAKGYTRLGTLPSDLPPTLLLPFFKSSDGSFQLIVSDGQTVWWTTDYVNFTSIKTGLSEFFQLRGSVIRDKVWLTNGSDAVMTWNGSALVELDGTGGTPNVPKGKFIGYHDERVFMYGINGDLSASRFSALANSSGTEIAPDHADAWPASNELQISEGDGDRGTGIFSLRGYLYFAKQYSIYRLVGYDEYTYSRVKTRASTGTRFQESIQIRDNTAEFIGIDGHYVFDGEEALRVSDIVDPETSEPGVFAFRNLQQSLLNTQFWNVSNTASFAAGTVAANLSTSGDRLSLSAADDSQAEFAAGATQTNIDTSTTPGSIQLSLQSSGGSTNVSQGVSGSLDSPGTVIGAASSITDGSTAVKCGHKIAGGPVSMDWRIDLGSAMSIGRIVLKNFYAEGSSAVVSPNISTARLEYSSDASSWSTAATITLPATASGGSAIYYSGTRSTYYTDSDIDTSFSTISARYWRLFVSATNTTIVISELQAFQAPYETSGQFISESIDFGTAPNAWGALAATVTLNGETVTFFTQSSTDGSTWSGEATVPNNDSITSPLRRYLRWGAYFSSSTGVSTPVIHKVYLPGSYLSEIHNTGGNIFRWGAFEIDTDPQGQQISVYYRAASTEAGVALAAWTAIVAGAIPSTAVTNVFIQIRIEMYTTDADRAPAVNSFTVNWIESSGTGVNTLQNVASVVILNRYWLAAATLEATENDIVIVRGKSTFKAPWHKKDFAFLSFARVEDYFIAGSSTDGSIYRLESGYSKHDEEMDCYYETGDFTKAGFIIKGYELLVTLERSGEYTISVGFSTDGGETYTEKTIDLTRDDGDSLVFTKHLNIRFMSEKVRFRVRINDVDKPFAVETIRCRYRLIPQRGTIGS